MLADSTDLSLAVLHTVAVVLDTVAVIVVLLASPRRTRFAVYPDSDHRNRQRCQCS